MNILELSNVNKSYGNFKAVDSLSLSVKPGTIFGLLGPNGAGKTTTIRMIMAIILPDNGNILFEGRERTMADLQKIGYLPEERGLYPKMKIMDILIFLGQLKGLCKSEAIKKTEYWLERLSLSKWRLNKVQDLSKGMQQKIQFIATVMSDPKILILDEPFSGLDPINTKVIKDIILELKMQGKAIIFSTHIMEQVEKLCDHIVLINKGQNILDGNLSEVKRKFRRNAFRLFFDHENHIDFSKYEEIKHIKEKEKYIEIHLKNGSEINSVLTDILKDNKINRFEIYEPSLNNIFINVVEGKNE